MLVNACLECPSTCCGFGFLQTAFTSARESHAFRAGGLTKLLTCLQFRRGARVLTGRSSSSIRTGLAQGNQGAADPSASPVQDMGVDHRGLHALAAKDLLDGLIPFARPEGLKLQEVERQAAARPERQLNQWQVPRMARSDRGKSWQSSRRGLERRRQGEARKPAARPGRKLRRLLKRALPEPRPQPWPGWPGAATGPVAPGRKNTGSSPVAPGSR